MRWPWQKRLSPPEPPQIEPPTEQPAEVRQLWQSLFEEEQKLSGLLQEVRRMKGSS